MGHKVYRFLSIYFQNYNLTSSCMPLTGKLSYLDGIQHGCNLLNLYIALIHLVYFFVCFLLGCMGNVVDFPGNIFPGFGWDVYFGPCRVM